MVLLGLLFVLAAGTAVVLLLLDNMSEDASYTVSFLGDERGTVEASTIFVAGLVLAGVFCLGLALVAAGSLRARRRRAALRDAELRAEEANAERIALESRTARDPGTEERVWRDNARGS